MNVRTKVSVALILGIGALGSTVSIVRFPYIYQLIQTEDFLWATSDVAIWSTVEVGTGITASSMATMRPLFVAFLSRSKRLGSHNGTYSRNASKLGYCRKDNADVEELQIYSKYSKSIHFTTTVINSETVAAGGNKDADSISGESQEALKKGVGA